MGDPIRILQVVVNMNRGGAETLLMNLYRNIDRSKVQFDFLTCKQGVFDQEIEEMGGKVHRIPYISDVGHFGYVKELKKFFTNNREYKIIHSHLDKMSGLVLRVAKKAGITILLAHSHNTSSEGGIAARIYKWHIGGLIRKNASHVFACSSQASNWLFGRRANEAIILKNGIELERFKYQLENRYRIRNELGIEKECLVLGHIGRFSHQKNHSLLVEIFAEVMKSNPKSYLMLIGEGPLKPVVEEQVSSLGLQNNVLFLGVRSDVQNLLQSIDVLTFPSLHEGLPVTLIEAQGAGVHCLISDVITNEVDVGAGLINYENINNTPKVWAEKILEPKQAIKDTSMLLKKKGYDIAQTASWLQEYYLKITLSNTEDFKRVFEANV